MKNYLLKIFLKGTWHTCKHEWECMVADEKGCIGWKCKKCHVQSTLYQNTQVIIVNPKDNHPFLLSPWGINKRGAIGINIAEGETR